LVIKTLDPDPYLDRYPNSLERPDTDPQLCFFQDIFDMSFLTLGGPVFVYDWPAASKPFYMARSREVRTFQFFSLVPVPMFCLIGTGLVPGVSENLSVIILFIFNCDGTLQRRLQTNLTVVLYLEEFFFKFLFKGMSRR
jgi:hypothetical protein